MGPQAVELRQVGRQVGRQAGLQLGRQAARQAGLQAGLRGGRLAEPRCAPRLLQAVDSPMAETRAARAVAAWLVAMKKVMSQPEETRWEALVRLHGSLLQA